MALGKCQHPAGVSTGCQLVPGRFQEGISRPGGFRQALVEGAETTDHVLMETFSSLFAGFTECRTW